MAPRSLISPHTEFILFNEDLEWHTEDSLGRPPLTGRWTNLHSRIAERATAYLAAVDADERQEFERLLDEFLEVRGRDLGCRRLRANHGMSGVSRWVAPGSGQPNLLSDVHLFATSFSAGEQEDGPWQALLPLLNKIRPTIQTYRRATRAAANQSAAFFLVLTLLADRAGRNRDAEAIEKAEEILSIPSVAGALLALAWRGAHMLEVSSDGGKKSRTSNLRSNDDLMKVVFNLRAEGIPDRALVSKIVERYGGGFGVNDHVRVRLQRLNVISKRVPHKPR